jgi:hypothetical protein
MVDVRDNRNISKGGTGGHGLSRLVVGTSPQIYAAFTKW